MGAGGSSGSRESVSEQEVAPHYKTSRLALREVLPPAKLYLEDRSSVTFLNSTTKRGTSVQTHESTRAASYADNFTLLNAFSGVPARCVTCSLGWEIEHGEYRAHVSKDYIQLLHGPVPSTYYYA